MLSLVRLLLQAAYYAAVAALFPALWLAQNERALLSFSLGLLGYYAAVAGAVALLVAGVAMCSVSRVPCPCDTPYSSFHMTAPATHAPSRRRLVGSPSSRLLAHGARRSRSRSVVTARRRMACGTGRVCGGHAMVSARVHAGRVLLDHVVHSRCVSVFQCVFMCSCSCVHPFRSSTCSFLHSQHRGYCRRTYDTHDTGSGQWAVFRINTRPRQATLVKSIAVAVTVISLAVTSSFSYNFLYNSTTSVESATAYGRLFNFVVASYMTI